MERIKGGYSYRLASGREFDAHRGIIGIGPDGRITEGYDDGIEIDREWDPEFAPWTAAEREELADEMIRRWYAFKGARPS
jgi:hypothetical protein